MPEGNETHSAPHKYLKVRDYLMSLTAGELAVGDPIPSERVLTERFGVSRMTVRHAIESLVSEGVLERIHGRGTFVSAPRMDFEVRLSTFGEQMHMLGLTASTTVLDSGSIAAHAEVASILGIQPGSHVYHLRRLRFADDEPMALEEAWIPVGLAPGLFDDGVPESLHAALREHGHDPSWGEETLSADTATQEEHDLLRMRDRTAVLRTTRRIYGDSQAVMYSRACFRGDRYQVWVPLAPRQGHAEPASSPTSTRKPKEST